MTEDERLDIDALEKTARLHDLQFSELKAIHNDSMNKIVEFMRVTNKTLKLHEEGIGLLAARLKKLEAQIKSSATSDASDATVDN